MWMIKPYMCVHVLTSPYHNTLRTGTWILYPRKAAVKQLPWLVYVRLDILMDNTILYKRSKRNSVGVVYVGYDRLIDNVIFY